VLDYKSNQVHAAGIPQPAENYALQMFVYNLACEEAIGVAPVESVLHFLRPATEFVFAWGDAERAARVELIDSAIQAELAVGPARSVNFNAEAPRTLRIAEECKIYGYR